MTDLAGSELRFEAPGPGSWALDAVNFPRPVTRYWEETQPAAVRRGSQELARYYGILSDGLRMEYVNGFAYQTRVAVPENMLPQRFQRAEEVFQKKLWREQLRDWDETFKPASTSSESNFLNTRCLFFRRVTPRT